MSGLKWALIVGLGLAVTPVAAQAQNGPSFNVIVNPQAQQAVPRRGPARDDYRGYRDNDRRYRAEDRRNSAYYRDRDHRDARRGPPSMLRRTAIAASTRRSRGKSPPASIWSPRATKRGALRPRSRKPIPMKRAGRQCLARFVRSGGRLPVLALARSAAPRIKRP